MRLSDSLNSTSTCMRFILFGFVSITLGGDCSEFRSQVEFIGKKEKKKNNNCVKHHTSEHEFNGNNSKKTILWLGMS